MEIYKHSQYILLWYDGQAQRDFLFLAIGPCSAVYNGSRRNLSGLLGMIQTRDRVSPDVKYNIVC
jgi:hypothetical protein